MNPLRDRYEDSHVRADESLIDVAEAYVQSYVGDFIFLAECRDRLLAGVGLTTSQVRGVLNCMRTDPRVLSLPIPVEHTGESAQVIPLRRPSVRMRPTLIVLKTRWPLPHVISNRPQARLVHTIDPVRSYVRYHPRDEKPFAERFQVTFRYVCNGEPMSYAGYPTLELISERTARDLVVECGWRMCGKCE